MAKLAPPGELAAGPVPSAGPDLIGVSVGDRLEIVAASSIDWFEAAGNYVRIHAGGSVVTARSTLAALWGRVGADRFRRIHRSVVVNVDRVAAVHPRANGDGIVALATGAELRLSRRYRLAFLSVFR